MGSINDSLTFRLFARPSFYEGISRILDFANSLQSYNYDKNGAEADAKALASDWQMVGRDMKAAVAEYGEKSTER